MSTKIDFNNKLATQPKESGFTLIELSIVLVIIGLIVGGVLSGQDLIQAAQLRSTIKQKESFDLAANTFRVKYGFIPGDYATSIGGFSGDGNGILSDIVGPTTTPAVTSLAAELTGFWLHLSNQGYVDGGYVGGAPAASSTAAELFAGTFLPRSKLSRSSTWAAFSRTTGNYYALSQISITAAGGTIATAESATSAAEASNIDSKMDDGVANAGTVRALSGASLTALGTSTGASTVSCVTNTTANVYATTATPGCQLRFLASF
jgi:prepilin-type N-terminal cleavage/methylation domain-containing protein